MQAHTYTTDEVLRQLGYPNTLAAAQQQARMMLLGRLARYQAEIKQLEVKWGSTLKDMRERYTAVGAENFLADDDYIQWQWYTDAIESVNAQLEAVSPKA